MQEVYQALTNSCTLYDCDIDSEWDIKAVVCLKNNLEKLSLRYRVGCWFEKYTQFYMSGMTKEKRLCEIDLIWIHEIMTP